MDPERVSAALDGQASEVLERVLTTPALTPVEAPTTLWGQDGAECLQGGPRDYYRIHLKYGFTPGRYHTVYEWSVEPVDKYLPSIEMLVELIADHATCNELLEEGYDQIIEAGKNPVIKEHVEALFKMIASQISWRQSDKIIKGHIFYMDLFGDVYLDGVLFLTAAEARK